MILQRYESTDEGTFGFLVFGRDWVHTLELPWRENIPNTSHIPAGEYTLRMRHSPKYGQCWHVTEVPRRSYILLHHGNFAGDRALNLRTNSAGCILLGSRRGRLYGQLAVLASRTARRKFELATGWEPRKLVIRDA